eukprot:751766-Hanusia_phi.AAC.1
MIGNEGVEVRQCVPRGGRGWSGEPGEGDTKGGRGGSSFIKNRVHWVQGAAAMTSPGIRQETKEEEQDEVEMRGEGRGERRRRGERGVRREEKEDKED